VACVPFGRAEGLGGGAETGRAVEVEGQAKLITELLREAALMEAAKDAVNQKLSLPLVDGAVLEAAAHEGAGPVMPVPATLLADEVHTPFDGMKIVDQQLVGDMPQVGQGLAEPIAARVRRAPCPGARPSFCRSAVRACH
jgi:hypothetical protein